MSPNLIEAIEASYRIFEKYHIGPDLDFAANVTASDGEQAQMKGELISNPLRSLSPDLVFAYAEYIDAAHYEGGYRSNEFRYFLPRLLELVATQALGSDWALECLRRNLDRAHFRRAWPGPEVEAIDLILSLADLESSNSSPI